MRLPRHGHRDVEAGRRRPGRGATPPARPGRSRPGVHRHPVPAGRPARAGRHRAARPPCRAGGRDRALPALGGGRPRHPGALSRRRGRAGGGARRGTRRPRGPARAPGRAGPGGGRAHGTDQPPARRAGTGGHHRGGAALLGFRSRPRGLPGHRDPPGGHRPGARRGRPTCRGALRHHGRERFGRGGARPGGPARRPLAHGAPGVGLPRDPLPSRAGRPARRLPGRGRPAHASVRPSPGLVVPPRSSHHLGRQRPRGPAPGRPTCSTCTVERG